MAMTANVPGSGVLASLGVPSTQQTAPVLEFRCLYTSDIRKKVKKWQDGRLKFHTFNKKIMVWDERSHFIGETYWRDDSVFGDGEELSLERNGTLVEVGECIGKYDTDLTDLVGKRVKDREERAAAKVANGTPKKFPPTFIGNQETPGSAHLRPKSLNAVLTPTGHYGRALMPNTSPFEDRQRLASEIPCREEERPAKRRKQESPPRKSGYAQNLMGTKISLTSSRPTSTASIQYEPVRVRPIQKLPAPTIDLTMDEDSGDAQTMDKAPRNEAIQRDRTAKIQKRRRPSPKAKSSYASNLTGTALTLSRPSDFSQRRAIPALSPNGNPIRKKEIPPDSFTSSATESNSSDVEPPLERSVAVEKTKTATENNPQSRRAINPRPQSITLALKTGTSLIERDHSLQKRSAPESSIIDPTPNRPTSALRIKSRPPRKMMMLMNRPSSRSSAPHESSTPNRPVLRPPDPHSEEPVLSQATIQLDAFCKKQEEAVKTRLNRRQPQMVTRDFSSSPPNSGINHQTIDLLLTRKSALNEKGDSAAVGQTTNEKTAEFSRKPNPSKVTGGSPRVGLDTDLSASLNPPSIAKEIGQSLPLTAVKQGNLATIPDCSPSDKERIRQPETSPESSLPTSTLEKSEYETAEIALEQEHRRNVIPKPTSADKSEEGLSFGTFVSSSTEAGASIFQRSKSVEQARDALHTSRPTNFVQPEKPPTVNSFRAKDRKAEDINNAIHSTPDHFRPIIKTSASPITKIGHAAPLPPCQQNKSEILGRRPEPNSDSESVSKEVGVKPTSGSPPIRTGAGVLDEVVSDLNIPPVKISGSQDAEMVQLKSLKPAVTQVRLANPATRGKSLQSVAANTVEALNPMAPPQPRIRSRGERPQVIEGAANRASTAVLREETPGGPWSREAFDLFGNWRPPDRPA